MTISKRFLKQFCEEEEKIDTQEEPAAPEDIEGEELPIADEPVEPVDKTEEEPEGDSVNGEYTLPPVEFELDLSDKFPKKDGLNGDQVASELKKIMDSSELKKDIEKDVTDAIHKLEDNTAGYLVNVDVNLSSEPHHADVNNYEDAVSLLKKVTVSANVSVQIELSPKIRKSLVSAAKDAVKKSIK